MHLGANLGYNIQDVFPRGAWQGVLEARFPLLKSLLSHYSGVWPKLMASGFQKAEVPEGLCLNVLECHF